MNHTNRIEATGLIGKSFVEMTPWDRDSKEWAKLGIEGVELLLKSMQGSKDNEQTSAGSVFEQVRQIKETARQCSIQRVVMCPFNDTGHIKTMILTYEGDMDTFCNRTGLIKVSGYLGEKEYAELAEMERQYGIILYDRD